MRHSDSNIRVIVVDADVVHRNTLASQLGEGTVVLRSVADLGARLDGEPMVLIIGPSCAGAPGLLGAEDLVRNRPEVGAILLADEPSTELLARVLKSGIRDVLTAPVDASVLNESVRRVAVSLGPDAGASTANADRGPSGARGKVITVFSTKGGVGTSVVATNLAVVLAKRAEKTVALVDADLQFGDVAVMLKLDPQHTLVDAVGSDDRLDADTLRRLLTRHPASGVLVLAAPPEPAVADQIDAPLMHRVIDVLRTFCDYVVVDTPSYLDDVVLGLLEQSDEVLLVSGMDIPSIKNVKIGLQTLRLLDTPMIKVHLVLNRSDSKVRLEVNDVERTLNVKAGCLIPSDSDVPRSVNTGSPVVTDAPKAGVSRAIARLADLVAPAPAEKKKRNS